MRPLDILRAAGDPEETECTRYVFTALRRFPRPLSFIIGDAVGTAQCAGTSAAVEVLSTVCDAPDELGNHRLTVTARVAGPPGSSFYMWYWRRLQDGRTSYTSRGCSTEIRTEPCAPEEEECISCEGWNGYFSGPCPCPGGAARAEGDPEETVCTYTTYRSPQFDPPDIVAIHTTASGPSYTDLTTITCPTPQSP
jgi:hypothetical protein